LIRIIKIENPFDPKIKEVSEIVYLAMPITAYVQVCGRDIFLNGRKIAEENYETTIPLDGEEIISIPHIAGGGGLGDILGFVASVALSAFAGAIIGGSGLFGYSIAAHSVGAYLAAGAVMYLGGKIINAVFPQQAATLDANNTNESYKSQTYGWNLPTVATVEGGAIGETYGTCIPQPQLLEEHVETVDGKQYLNLLYCGGYGEVDSIDNVRIDTTPISCFDGVQLEYRYGTNDQKPISFFSDTPTDQAVGLLLDLNKPLIRTTDSKKASALEITLEWASGLYHLNDDGGYGSAAVTFKIDYRKSGSTDWTTQNTYTVSNASADAFRKSFKWTVSEPGQYDVRVTITDKPTGSRNMTYTQWSILTAYNSGIYARPNKVLIGMRILATNQLSGGVPNVTWRQTRSKVYAWNPKTGGYEEKAANNPIWAAYDIMHGCRRLKNINTGSFEYVVAGCAHEHLDAYYDEWAAAAAYADELIKNHDGEQEKRFQFDAYYDTGQKRYDAAVKAAAVGHANIIIHGCNYGITVDRPGTICQIFGEGRTTVSSVSGTFQSRDDRAKAVEITYNDADNDYKNTQFTLRSDMYAKDNKQDNTAQLTLFGVSRRSQAYREGITALATNERQLQTIELSTDIDGITAEYGDIVGYTHAISKIGIASGRIVEATDTTVTLDKTIAIDAGKTYEIYIQLANDVLVKRDVVPATASTNTLTVAQSFDKIPQEYDCYSFGESGKSVKPYRIVGAERDGDLLCKLKMMEYDPAVYATELDYSKYPKIDYTAIDTTTTKNVTASEETYTQRDGSVVSNINIEWEASQSYYQGNADGYTILISGADGKTEEYQTTAMHYRYSGAVAGITYKIAVKINVNGNKINGGSTSITIIGKDTPPADVSYLSLVQDNSNITATILPVTDIDIDHYDIRMGAIWETSAKIGHFTGTSYTFPAAQNGTCSYLVKAFDTSGNESKNAKKQIINITNVAATNVIYDHTFNISNFASWQNLYRQNDALCMLDTRSIKDFDKFADIFGQLNYIDGVVYLPLIDLGENIIDHACYWIDSKSIIHQQEVGKIKDYDKFADMFGAGGDLVAPISLASTFISVLIDGTSSKDINRAVEYRTSIDGYTYSDWTPDAQTIFRGRFVQIRIHMSSVSGHTQGTIKAVTVQIDVPDVDITLENIDLIASLNYVPYSHNFMETPSSISPFTVDLAGKSVAYQITERDNKGFKICLYDDSNNMVAGKITRVFIRGY